MKTLRRIVDSYRYYNSVDRTVTMVLGEFEYADMEKRFDEAGDKVSYFFTMVLLLAMILFGTITMINLFVGVVVSDVNQLHNDVLKTVV